MNKGGGERGGKQGSTIFRMWDKQPIAHVKRERRGTWERADRLMSSPCSVAKWRRSSASVPNTIKRFSRQDGCGHSWWSREKWSGEEGQVRGQEIGASRLKVERGMIRELIKWRGWCGQSRLERNETPL